MAATRYCRGDDFTDADFARLRSRSRRPESVAFAAVLRARPGNVVHCVPGFVQEVPNPTAVGLGDTFVGSVLAEVARREPG
jgi:hypothetical protein